MTGDEHGSASLTFLGGAGTVTGSKFLVRTHAGQRLLVDCGLFQGRKELRLRNWEPLEVDPASIDAVVLTHAHVDHCGYLPRLIADGFSGPVWCTPGTMALISIVLPDAGRLQEEEAEYANRRGYSRHHPARPLFTEAEAITSLAQVRMLEFDTPAEVLQDCMIEFRHAGHIVGAASLMVHLGATSSYAARRILFSGDLGRRDHPLLRAPEPVTAHEGVDVILCETTYGDEDRTSEDDPAGDTARRLEQIITSTARRGGVVLIPAFAVDRTEMILHHLDRLRREERIVDLPIIVDSPMASAALDVYRHMVRTGSPEIRPEIRGTELFPHLSMSETRRVEESKALSARHGPMIIISASGMATGGRILHHLAARMGDDRTAIVLAGYQAPGTRGHRLAQGERTIKLLGAYRQVAAEVHQLALSAHADRTELTEWIRTAVGRDTTRPPTTVYCVHGEPAASSAFAAHLSADQDLGARTLSVMPAHGEIVRLDR